MEASASQALCWFLDEDRSGDPRWDLFSLTRQPGQLEVEPGLSDEVPAVVAATAGGVRPTTAQCPEGRTVELVTIEGGGHAWPGTTRSGPLDASPSPGPVVPSKSPAAAPAAGPLVGPTVGPTTAPTGSATPGGSTVATAASTAYDTTVSLWAFFKAHVR